MRKLYTAIKSQQPQEKMQQSYKKGKNGSDLSNKEGQSIHGCSFARTSMFRNIVNVKKVRHRASLKRPTIVGPKISMMISDSLEVIGNSELQFCKNWEIVGLPQLAYQRIFSEDRQSNNHNF